jgi:hypothetical protein
MSYVAELYPLQKRLNETIRNAEKFGEARELFLELHASVHFAPVGQEPTALDRLWETLEREEFAVMPTVRDVTIAWNIWHVTRIEDLTVNYLIDGRDQLLDKAWLNRLGTSFADTGNAMSDEEIMCLSRSLNPAELKEYRIAVGENTRRILSGLRPEDMKRKAHAGGRAKIIGSGGVTGHPDSIWLVDFWGRKDVAGLIAMPVTRHQLGHINDSFGLKDKIHKKKTPFYMA